MLYIVGVNVVWSAYVTFVCGVERNALWAVEKCKLSVCCLLWKGSLYRAFVDRLRRKKIETSFEISEDINAMDIITSD